MLNSINTMSNITIIITMSSLVIVVKNVVISISSIAVNNGLILGSQYLIVTITFVNTARHVANTKLKDG